MHHENLYHAAWDLVLTSEKDTSEPCPQEAGDWKSARLEPPGDMAASRWRRAHELAADFRAGLTLQDINGQLLRPGGGLQKIRSGHRYG